MSLKNKKPNKNVAKNINKLTPEQKENRKMSQFVKEIKKNKKPKLSKDEMDKRIANWQLFYLNNLDIFVSDVLQIPTKEFQKHILSQVMEYDRFNIVASRRLGKTLTISEVAISLALLLPNINIVIVSLTLHQANLIIKEKIDEMFSSPTSTKLNSPILQQLRKDGWIKFVKNKDTGGLTIEIGNNSKIFAVACGEQARGKNKIKAY